MDIATVLSNPAAPLADSGRSAQLRAAAEALESSFLAEMLRHAGVGSPRQTGGGGAGEEAFAGFLADAYAEQLTSQGGIGLSEQIFNALVAREGGTP